MAYSQDVEQCVDEQPQLSLPSNISSKNEQVLLSENNQKQAVSESDRQPINSSMDTFFERRKSDMMYELRNIQHGERPVTGQNYRESIQKFMKKHMPAQNETAGKGNVPANVDSVEEHRPDSVVFEVQGIIEQRPVSSMLQSVAFRRQLENIIRGSIVGPVSHNLERTRTRVQGNGSRLPNTTQRRVPERRPERPVLERSESSDSISSQDSFSSVRSSIDQDLNDTDTEIVASSAPILPPREPLPSNSSPAPSPRVEPQRRQNLPPISQGNARDDYDTAYGGRSLSDISRVHREELVQELSELVHSRLVSSTLNGELRATLEMHIQDRVPSDGLAIQEFVRSLPGRGIPRNDFSHLGIPNVHENDNWDNISVTSVSAHSVPYTQTNSYMSREIQSLKSQMTEMKNMLKISVDLQMDIQRAIRQEVAASLAQNAAQGACAAPNLPSSPVDDTQCLICLDRHSDTVLYQCGHMCVCYICGKNLIAKNHNCPVCRAPIKDVIRAYKTNAE